MEPTTYPKLPSGAVYDKLKATAQVLLPGVQALYFALAQIWGFPFIEQVNGTLAAINLFVGVAVVWLKSLYAASGAKYDGSMAWVEGDEEGDSILRLVDVNLHALETKGEILLQVTGRRGQ